MYNLTPVHNSACVSSSRSSGRDFRCGSLSTRSSSRVAPSVSSPEKEGPLRVGTGGYTSLSGFQPGPEPQDPSPVVKGSGVHWSPTHPPVRRPWAPVPQVPPGPTSLTVRNPTR